MHGLQHRLAEDGLRLPPGEKGTSGNCLPCRSFPLPGAQSLQSLLSTDRSTPQAGGRIFSKNEIVQAPPDRRVLSFHLPLQAADQKPATVHLPTWSQQIAIREGWLVVGHAMILDMMRRHNIDMWIIVYEEFHNDPLTEYIAPPRPYTGNRDIFVFVDTERLCARFGKVLATKKRTSSASSKKRMTQSPPTNNWPRCMRNTTPNASGFLSTRVAESSARSRVTATSSSQKAWVAMPKATSSAPPISSRNTLTPVSLMNSRPTKPSSHSPDSPGAPSPTRSSPPAKPPSATFAAGSTTPWAPTTSEPGFNRTFASSARGSIPLHHGVSSPSLPKAWSSSPATSYMSISE